MLSLYNYIRDCHKHFWRSSNLNKLLIIFLFLSVLILSQAVNSSAVNEVQLQYNFVEGSITEIEYISSASGTMGPSKDNQNNPFNQNTRLLLEYKVESVDSLGNADLTMDFKYLKTDATIGNSTYSFESTPQKTILNGTTVWDKSKNEIDNPFFVMTGKNFELTVNSLGDILKVNNDINWKDSNKELYMLNWRKIWIQFTETKVNPGDTWKKENNINLPGNPEGLPTEITYRLDGFQDIDGAECAVISQKSSIKGASTEFKASYGLNFPYTDVKPGELAQMDFNTYNNNSNKTIIFDHKNGRIVQIRETGTIESDSSITDYQFSIIPVDVEIYQKQNYINVLNYTIK